MTSEIDPITLEVIRNSCIAISEEMNATLTRSSYSPNIKERFDCSNAIFDGMGEMISQAENIPAHLGGIPFSVEAAIDAFPPSELVPGDSIVVNDPFTGPTDGGGSHLADFTLVTPIFAGDEIIAFAANRAHHADVGGAAPGSNAPDATDIFQEGVRVPPIKLFEAGSVSENALEIILANVRTPDERQADLRAQQAANRKASERLRELEAEHGVSVLTDTFDEIKDYSERRTREAIRELPDGEYQFEDYLDSDGLNNEDIRIFATVTVDGDSLHVDFSGTDDEAEGAVNTPFAGTAAAVYYVVRCVTDPDIPPNHGCYRPITIEAPEGTIVNAKYPAATSGYASVLQLVSETLFGAFAQAVPERLIAGSVGTVNTMTVGGVDPATGDPYAFYESNGGGMGARATMDGIDGVHVHISNTRNTPIETIETEYPLRIRQYSFRTDTGGPGTQRGGLGVRRDIRVEGDAKGEATATIRTDRQVHPAYGLSGGKDGGPGEAYIIRDGEELPLDSKGTFPLEPGDVLSLRTAGGGGYGDPEDRDPEEVMRDVRLEKVSREQAREEYGVEFRDHP